VSGLVTLFVVFGLVRLSSRSLAIETIILAGIIVSAFVGSLISLLIALGDKDSMSQIIYWLYGSVGMRGWSHVKLMIPFMIVGTIILACIIVSAFVGSLISLLIALGDKDSMSQIIYWLYGSVGMRGWSHVKLMIPFMIVGTIILLIHDRELNALALGEEAADHIGVDVKKGKIFILIGASLLTGAAVSVSGSIGFVGLVIPHLVRLITGPNHRHVLPLSLLIGGAFLISADLVSRTIIAPKELPIGVITALIGAPVFAVLLIREKFERGGSA